MKLSFHGAAQTVTGSKHLLTLANGRKILFDCGMFQGMGPQTGPLNASFGFNAAEIDYLLLSHAHIDHSGLVPRLVKDGFKGKIFCTPATKGLTEILLEDSAGIQQEDTRFINKKRKREGLPLYQPLYTLEDVRQVLHLLQEVQYGQWFTIEHGIEVLYTDAGHITGSAAVHVRIAENGKTTQVSFSGDVGRYNDVILRSPQAFPQADYIIIESTYGNSLHENIFNATDQLSEWIQKTCVAKRGKLLIPAFSVGRTQELLYALNQLSNENHLPPVPVFVDSPLGLEATAVVKRHPENYNGRVQKLLLSDNDPFNFHGLHFISSVQESKAINQLQGPCIIIASSGMADSGRIKHHIANNIHDGRNTVLMVGYCEPNSLGGKLMNGAKEVKIFAEYYTVKAEVGSMRSMSAHGDYNDLSQFLSCQHTDAVKAVFIVHGEYDVQQAFQKKLLTKGFKNVQVPAMHQVTELL